jgi:hypothetical protein
MSTDQLFAAAKGSAVAAGARTIAYDEVVVPLRAPTPVGTGAPRPRAPGVPAGARSAVAQIADYLSRAPRHPAPPHQIADTATLRTAPRGAVRPHLKAPIQATIAAHADELDWLLRQHIESHLDLIAAHTPDLAQPVDNVRRSVALLLKLHRR